MQKVNVKWMYDPILKRILVMSSRVQRLAVAIPKDQRYLNSRKNNLS